MRYFRGASGLALAGGIYAIVWHLHLIRLHALWGLRLEGVVSGAGAGLAMLRVHGGVPPSLFLWDGHPLGYRMCT